MEKKKLVRKAEPPFKRGMRWPRWTGFRNKTIWDLLQLLIVPLMLVAIGFLFTVQQDARQNQLEDQRAERERELADQRAQDETLQAYLDQMSLLMLQGNLPDAKESSPVRTLARARTITVLDRVDPSRRTELMQFLVEANLVNTENGGPPPIELDGANLEGIVLTLADLSGAELSDANLSDAELAGADLSGANLFGATLRNAYLARSEFSNANLAGTTLSNVTFGTSNFSGTNLAGAELDGASLIGAYLNNAELSNVDFTEARLDNVELTGADLFNADLRGARLSGARLDSADLTNVDGITKQQLEQQALSLKGTTMPGGTVTAGLYAPYDFEPALSFSLSDGWRLAQPEQSDAIPLYGPEGGQLLFTVPKKVFDSSNPRELSSNLVSEVKKVPAPGTADEWISWFQKHPLLETSKPDTVTVGGASGTQIGVRYASASENHSPPEHCGPHPCVPLFPLSEFSVTYGPLVSMKGWTDWFIIVDIEDNPVVIDAAVASDKSDEFLPEAEKVLETVEWENK